MSAASQTTQRPFGPLTPPPWVIREYRCEGCDKLLFKGGFRGRIEIVCTRCRTKRAIEEAD